MRLLFTIALFLVAAGIARADQEEPKWLTTVQPATREHFQKGIAFYDQKDYRAAAIELEAAYNLEPRYQILYAWAQAERLRGNCVTAADLYQKYIEQNPQGKQVPTARYHYERCKEVVRPPWYKDALGDTLTGAGVLSLGLGTYFLVSSISDANARPVNWSDHDQQQQSAQTERTVSLILLGTGTALVSAGIVRYWTRSSSSTSTEGKRAQASFWSDGRQAGFMLFGQF